MSLRDYLFYQEPGIELYCGDCREVLPLLEMNPIWSCVLADPPYGIGHNTSYASRGRGQLAATSDFPPCVGDDKPFDPEMLLRVSGESILWGANHYSTRLPPGGSWLIWDKRVREGIGVNDHADAEMAWTSIRQPVRIFRHMWNGFWRDSEKGESYHPMQKPVALMTWCLSFTDARFVIDPYSGSGPVLLAAKMLNRNAIGIEIEPKYCEIAIKRLRQEVLPL